MRHKVNPAPSTDLESNGLEVQEVVSLTSHISSCFSEEELLKLAAAHIDDAEKGTQMLMYF